MSPSEPTGAENLQVRLVAGPDLWHVDFQRIDGSIDVPQGDTIEGKLSFNVGFSRVSRERLGVEFSVGVEGVPSLRAFVTYRVVLEVSPADPDDAVVENAMKTLGGRIAPTLVYPFVRETLESVTRKSGLSPVVLPVVNFGNVFDVGAMAIPQVATPPQAVVLPNGSV